MLMDDIYQDRILRAIESSGADCGEWGSVPPFSLYIQKRSNEHVTNAAIHLDAELGYSKLLLGRRSM